MKYTNAQRLERIVSTTRKLLDYIRDQQVTRDDILNQEPLRWTITTPLYNVGEHVYNLRRRIQNGASGNSLVQNIRPSASVGT